MIQILATLGIVFIINLLVKSEDEVKGIARIFTITGFLKNMFFIYLVYAWLGTFMS